MRVKEFIAYNNSSLEDTINEFIALNEDKIDVLDIKFCTRDESTRSFILYNHKPMSFKEQIEARMDHKKWCEAHKDEETTTPC